MKHILFILFAALTFASCQKEVDGDAGNTGGGSGGGGATSDYQPVSAN